MNIHLGEKLKELRAEKGISQEKLAAYLNVSFQAVSKWENENTYPDITLLPEIARFFGVTIDALLQTDRPDEAALFAEYEETACALYRNGDVAGALAVWQEAYHAMPNNPAVMEMLMSAYYDTDKVAYKKEIIELGTALYNASLAPDADNACAQHTAVYYRGQAIEQLAKTYFVNGETAPAEAWAEKASFLMHSQEHIFAEITHGNDLLTYFRFANYWYFKNLFYMVCRITEDAELSADGYGQEVSQALAKLYEIVYPDGDTDFEMAEILVTLHRCIAEDETMGEKNEAVIRYHLTKAADIAVQSAEIWEHRLQAPLLRGLSVGDAPSDRTRLIRRLQQELTWTCFAPYRHTDWFAALIKELEH